jgi:hypothetical protein
MVKTKMPRSLMSWLIDEMSVDEMSIDEMTWYRQNSFEP